jgi:hypothetical protein
MKLQQEKHDREVELEDAGWRVKNSTAPNEETEHEWCVFLSLCVCACIFIFRSCCCCVGDVVGS